MTPNSLTESEQNILWFLSKAKYATTKQLARLYFSSSVKESTALRRANLVTKKLKDNNYISHLARRIGGVRAGSGSYVWRITTAGLKALKQHGFHLAISRKNAYEPSWHHLKHTLAIAELYVQLVELNQARTIQNMDTFQFEPDSWRGWLNNHAGRMILKPDSYIELSLDDYIDSYFIEADKNTESLTRVINKSKQYIRYYNLNIEQTETGVFPLVLWVVPDDKRKVAIEQRIQRDLDSHWELFQVITLDDFKDFVAGGVSDGKED